MKAPLLLSAVCALEVLRQYEGSVTCPGDDYTLVQGRCSKINRLSPTFTCPEHFFLADSVCNQAVKPRWICPDGMVMIDNAVCESTVTAACQSICPTGYIPTAKGTSRLEHGCLKEVRKDKSLYCPLGRLEQNVCVVEYSQPLVESCEDPTAVLDNGECLTLTIAGGCNRSFNTLNLRHNMANSTQPCIRVQTRPTVLSCPPGFVADGATCKHMEYSKPLEKCPANTSPNTGEACIDVEFAASSLSCDPGYTMKTLFGFCTCSKKVYHKARVECPMDGEYRPELEHCIRKASVRFDCPSGYQLRDTYCERLLTSAPKLVFNATMACSVQPGKLATDPRAHCSAADLEQMAQLLT